ncbi:hypothetical protein PO870_29760 [Rhizobium sp. MJ37]|nr:hypothetical protein [Rhizobium sp. MJ37]
MAKGYISSLSRPSRLGTMRIITGWLGFDGCEEFRQCSKVLPRRPQYISAGNRKIDDGFERTNDTAGSPADFTRRHIGFQDLRRQDEFGAVAHRVLGGELPLAVNLLHGVLTRQLPKTSPIICKHSESHFK